MNTKNAVSEVNRDIVEELKRDMGLAVIDRKDTGVAVPRITGFGVVERCEEDGTPLKTELDTRTGSMNLVIDSRAFVKQVFNGLTIAGGEHKGKLLSQELIDEEIKIGKELLLKDDLFEGETSEEYRVYQLKVSKMFTAADNKRKELKDPVNQISKAFQGLLRDTLGELIEIRAAVMARTKEHKIEVEKREREATAKDNLLREETADEIQRIAYLALNCLDKSAGEVKIISAELLATNFTPHPDQADRYNEALSQTTQALAVMCNDKVKEEVDAALKAEQAAKEAAAAAAELAELRAGKVEQELKDAAGIHLANINHYFSECVGVGSEEIRGAIEAAKDDAGQGVENKYLDINAINIVIGKMEDLFRDTKQKEADAAAAAKAETDRIAKEASDKKEKEDREKAEVAAALKEFNQELLLAAGFVFDGKAYTKGGFLLQLDMISGMPTGQVNSLIMTTDEKIAANEAAAKKAEEARIKKEEAAKKKAAAEKEAARKSYALKVEEMTIAVKECKGPDEMVMAILEGRIPHVRFADE